MGDENGDTLKLDLENHLVRRDHQIVFLSRRELALLELLVRHEGHVLAFDNLGKTLWREEDRISRQDNLKHYVYRLRQKIESDPSHPRYLETVDGKGYRFQRSRP